MFSLPPWLMSLVMKVVIRFLPSIKQIFTGHSNDHELKSYCQDVMTTAEEMNINIPRFKENKNLFQQPIQANKGIGKNGASLNMHR
jgi:hypothetical protein